MCPSWGTPGTSLRAEKVSAFLETITNFTEQTNKQTENPKLNSSDWKSAKEKFCLCGYLWKSTRKKTESKAN